MAIYLRRGGLDVAPPPWRCDDIEATIFYVASDRATLQDLCDRTLNRPSGAGASAGTRLRYRPLVDWVALTFQRFTDMRSIAPPDPGSLVRETHTYSEAAFWVMVENGSGMEVLVPYMFIDDGACMAAGREIYGFPKEMAALAMPPFGHPTSNAFTVDALATVMGSVDATSRRVLECRSRGGSILAPVAADLEAVGRTPTLGAMWELLRALLAGRLPFVFLRQFRALAGGLDADCQHVVGADAKPFQLKSLRPLLSFELVLPILQSHPIAGDLGLRRSGVVDAPVGCQCELSFTLQPGRIL